MGGHLAIQGDLAQLDLAVFPACGSRDLSGSTGPLPGIHSCFSAWNTFATASLDHSSPSRHPGRPRGAMKRCSTTGKVAEPRQICTVFLSQECCNHILYSWLSRANGNHECRHHSARKTETRRFCIQRTRLDMPTRRRVTCDKLR